MTNEAQTETRTAHTAGPWKVDHITPNSALPAAQRRHYAGKVAHIYTDREYPKGVLVATVREHLMGEVEANAHLIAAAPVLLEALLRARIAQESLLERLELSHMKCDESDDYSCYAEQYGDGTPDEHEALRDYRRDIAETDAAIRAARGDS